MWRTWLVLVVVASSFAGVVTVIVRSSADGEDVVRIAAWNLRQFNAERVSIDLDAVAAVIRGGGFHVVALQEITRDGGGVDALAARLGGSWKATVSGRTGSTRHRFAFLYDTNRVRLLQTGFVAGTLDADRRPFVGYFVAGQFDFTLVNVHLPAADARARRAEAEVLAGLLDGAVVPAGTRERDVIILGDFNTTRRTNNSITPFVSRGWLAVIDKPTNLGDTHTLDNIVFDPGHVREFLGRSGVVRFDDGHDAAAMRRSVSDHRPVWADFRTDLPDDD